MEVAGERVTGASERRLSALRRRHIGFVFQFFHLLPELTGEGNVLLAGRVPGAAPEAGGARPGADRAARARRRGGLPPAPALRRRAAALRDRAGARQRPVAAAGRRADGEPRRGLGARPCCSCCGRSRTRAARSCSSPTSRRPRGSPTGCCGSTRGSWCPREAPAAARGARDRGGVARRRDRRDGRVRARDRVRARGGAGGPPARHRALRRGVARDGRRARARAAQRGRALVPAGSGATRSSAARGEQTGKATLDFLLGGRRGYAVVEGRDLRGAGRGAGRARAGARLGARGSATR